MEAIKSTQEILSCQLNIGVNIRLTEVNTVEIKKINRYRTGPVLTKTYIVDWQTAGGTDWNPIDEFSTLNKALVQFRRMTRAASSNKLTFTHNDNQRKREGLHSPQ